MIQISITTTRPFQQGQLPSQAKENHTGLYQLQYHSKHYGHLQNMNYP